MKTNSTIYDEDDDLLDDDDLEMSDDLEDFYDEFDGIDRDVDE